MELTCNEKVVEVYFFLIENIYILAVLIPCISEIKLQEYY